MQFSTKVPLHQLFCVLESNLLIKPTLGKVLTPNPPNEGYF